MVSLKHKMIGAVPRFGMNRRLVLRYWRCQVSLRELQISGPSEDLWFFPVQGKYLKGRDFSILVFGKQFGSVERRMSIGPDI